MDVPLDFLNISLSVLLSLQLWLIQRLLKFGLLLLFHSGKLDLNEVLFLLVSSFKGFAILLPSHEFKLVLELLLTNVFHLIKGLILLWNFNIDVFDLLFGWVINSLDRLFILINSLILLFFIPLFKSLNLVLKFNQLLRVLSVGSSVLKDNLFSVLNLLFVPILQVVDLGVPKQSN